MSLTETLNADAPKHTPVPLRTGRDALHAQARLMLRVGGPEPTLRDPAIIRAAWREHQRRVAMANAEGR